MTLLLTLLLGELVSGRSPQPPVYSPHCNARPGKRKRFLQTQLAKPAPRPPEAPGYTRTRTRPPPRRPAPPPPRGHLPGAEAGEGRARAGAAVPGCSQPRGAGARTSGSSSAASPPGGSSGGGGAVPLPQAHIGSIVRRRLPLSGSPSQARPFPLPSTLPQPHRATKGTAGPASDASGGAPLPRPARRGMGPWPRRRQGPPPPGEWHPSPSPNTIDGTSPPRPPPPPAPGPREAARAPPTRAPPPRYTKPRPGGTAFCFA
ncbi:proline-rich protein 2-like [Rattus norvegicus]|uniref:proline-rich protein 2-like n=1 Tax=Rattus norvegicus TaxID=10116 RepID=UPI001916DC8D|nr:proline-rich protein 2-like [Rattus norvegicus]